MTTPEIHAFMRVANGGRSRSFVLVSLTVLVQAHEDDARGEAVAEHLASAHEVIEKLRSEVAELRAVVPPSSTVRLLVPGCVRMRGNDLWILNRAEDGWSSFGFRAGSWDDLFRRFDVRVTGHGRDKTGEFWTVESCAPAGSST